MNETSKSKAEILDEVLFSLYPKLASALQVRHVSTIKEAMEAWHSQQSTILQSRITQLETEKAQAEGRVKELDVLLKEVKLFCTPAIRQLIDKALNKT